MRFCVLPGHTLIRQGAWIEALGFYEAALNLRSRSPGSPGQEADQEQQNCWLNCAFCHLNLEEYEAAIECLGRDVGQMLPLATNGKETTHQD